MRDHIYEKLAAIAELERPSRPYTLGEVSLMVVVNGLWYALIALPVVYFWWQ
jgi:hypothetical protein